MGAWLTNDREACCIYILWCKVGRPANTKDPRYVINTQLYDDSEVQGKQADAKQEEGKRWASLGECAGQLVFK